MSSFTWVRISRKDHGHDDGAAEQRQQWHARGRPPANARVRERRTPAQPGPRAVLPRAPTRRRTHRRALDSKRSAHLRPPSFAGRREPPQQLRDERTSEPAPHTHVRTARARARGRALIDARSAQRGAFADCHEPPTQRLPATSAARRASEPAPHTHTAAHATGVARRESFVSLFGVYFRVTKRVSGAVGEACARTRERGSERAPQKIRPAAPLGGARGVRPGRADIPLAKAAPAARRLQPTATLTSPGNPRVGSPSRAVP